MVQELHRDAEAEFVVEAVEHLLYHFGCVLIQTLPRKVVFDGSNDLFLHAPGALFNHFLDYVVAEFIHYKMANGVLYVLENVFFITLRTRVEYFLNFE